MYLVMWKGLQDQHCAAKCVDGRIIYTYQKAFKFGKLDRQEDLNADSIIDGPYELF